MYIFVPSVTHVSDCSLFTHHTLDISHTIYCLVSSLLTTECSILRPQGTTIHVIHLHDNSLVLCVVLYGGQTILPSYS